MESGKNVTSFVQYCPRTYFESKDSSTPEYLYLLRFWRYSAGMYRLRLMVVFVLWRRDRDWGRCGSIEKKQWNEE